MRRGLVAAAPFLPHQPCQGVERGPRVGVGIEPSAAFGAEAAPLAEQQGAAEQVGPDLHAVEAPFVALRPGSAPARRPRRTAAAVPEPGARGRVCRVWACSHRKAAKCHWKPRVRTGFGRCLLHY
jgi:hypothetical protein